jgi:signal transduction histidine kinase
MNAIHSDDHDAVAQLWTYCVANRQLFNSEFRLKCRAKGWRWTQAHAAPIVDASGQVTKWIGMIIDITERKTAEQQLIKNERQMSLALDIARMGFWTLDPKLQKVRMDSRMKSIWGESTEDEWLTLETVMQRIHPEDRNMVTESVNAALDPNGTGYYNPTDYRLVLNDGTLRWVAANGMTMYVGRGEQREAIELFGTVLDITHRKLAEDSLRESEERLQQLNAELEYRVQARTQELVDSEARLRATAEVAEQGNRQLRRLALELSRTEERERRRLAQILHDHVQQLLVGAKMRVERLSQGQSDSESEEQLVGVVTVLDVAINATRSLAVELVPPVLQTQGLPTALQWLAVHIKDHHNLILQLDIDPQANPSGEEARDLLFQSAREFLLNVIKHAGVLAARLELQRESEDVVLTVSDQGAGFVQNAATGSETTFGLFHLRERITALGGRLEIYSQPGHGTKVTARLHQ